MNIPEEVIDAVRELITIGVGRSGGMLSRLINAHVTLTVPEVQISDVASENYMSTALHRLGTEDTSYVTLKFSGELTGSFSLMIPYVSALNLVVILTEEEGSPDEMDALRVETLLEVGNIIISAVMSSVSILLTKRLIFEFPSYHSEKVLNLLNPLILNQSDIGIIARTHFTVQEKEIVGDIFILLTQESYHYIENRIGTIMERGL
ncbi:MAG: hypothetical protein CVV33_08500 [Methanomicrobiales archaeon HGW-Methanomicrobiales-4]|nr:MAG: hypothetical protein CVV33_08500 [Methanomicrobiales archaeon HGW-Methanomicrobiales-4]